MLIPPLVGQDGGGFDIIWLLLPLLCCMLMTGQRGEERRPTEGQLTEHWYTTQNIEEIYSAIEKELTDWKERAEEKAAATPESFIDRLRNTLSRQKSKVGVTIKESIPPRLFSMEDNSGPIYFELTEVEGGGTVVQTTFNNLIKNQMARFKTTLPLKIPATPVGKHCPACGKPILPEFNLCPYCGEELIKE
jgi:hypothetical protein